MNNNIKIDIIFPYVDCNDPEWQKLYYNNFKNYNSVDKKWDDWATGMKRFRPNGLLKYVFRGIEKNCDWVNKVHMIVQSESQIPEWLNTDEVNIIYHKDFIPEQFLPTFNSSSIEMFLQNIEPLSDYFIYGNDDTIFTSKISINDFFLFRNNKLSSLVFGIKLSHINPHYTGDILRSSNHKLLSENKMNDYVYRIQHTYLPHFKMLNNFVYKKYEKEILSNVSQFRNVNEHNQWLFSEYAYRKKLVENKKLTNFCTEIRKDTLNKILKKDFTKYKSICLNDHESTSDKEVNEVLNKLDNLFSQKCKYEK